MTLVRLTCNRGPGLRFLPEKSFAGKPRNASAESRATANGTVDVVGHRAGLGDLEDASCRDQAPRLMPELFHSRRAKGCRRHRGINSSTRHAR